MAKTLQEIFKEIRDTPYRIPLSYEEEDLCCTGKHKKFLQYLQKENYETRWRVCSFKWSDMNLPENISAMPHDDNCKHAYLEIKIDGDWRKVDATWDKALSGILPVNDEWDGVSDTKIAVPCITTQSPEESTEIIENENKEVVDADLKVSGRFYEAFNKWLEQLRSNSETRK